MVAFVRLEIEALIVLVNIMIHQMLYDDDDDDETVQNFSVHPIRSKQGHSERD